MLKNTFIFILTVFCFLTVWKINLNSNLEMFGTPYETYTVSNSSIAKIIPTEKFKLKSSYIKTGESVVVYGYDIDDVLKDLNAEIKFTETTTNGVSIYAFSKKLKNKITINNEIVNVQIFYNESKTVVGTPIIFGSF